MVVDHFRYLDCRHLGPVESAIILFGFRIVVWLKEESPVLTEMNGELACSVSSEFFASAGQAAHLGQAIGGVEVVEAPPNMLCQVSAVELDKLGIAIHGFR